MKNVLLLFLILFISFAAYSQRPRNSKERPVKRAAAKAPAKPLSENEQFERASALTLAHERISAMQKFLAAFPESQHRTAALEAISGSRVLLAEEKLNSGSVDDAIALFRSAVAEAPDPYTNEFFNESLAGVPSNLFWRGQRAAAAEIMSMLEQRAAANTTQLLQLANFYLSVENGADAMRVAKLALANEPNSAAAYRTIALAHRMNFELEESAAAYARSLELEPASALSRRGLAEMKRALGKPSESIALYREILSANPDDLPAQTGLVLSLFGAGERASAEAELARSLEKTPGNVILLAGAAYWYAAAGDGKKAVELGRKAVELEPRYIWSHIALARGLLAEKAPVEAERVLIKARQYGNFPTLEYEIAAARVTAGFYREAADDLKKVFAVENGTVSTKLGGRIPRAEKDIADLVALERKASIFEPASAADAERSAQVKALLEFTQKLESQNVAETEIAAAADNFVRGTDKMAIYRQLYAADTLLRKQAALTKAVEYTQAAADRSETALDVPDAGAAIMASGLYDSRTLAFSRNEFLLVPAVPRQTLSAILRGNIEETAGWALYYQNNYPASIVRLRRAISILPAQSAWWRSSMWRLGAALQAYGKDKEALDAYMSSYKTDKPDFAKYVVVESLYKKLNGGTEGLVEALGGERVAVSGVPATDPAPSSVPIPAGTPAAVTAEPPAQSAPVGTRRTAIPRAVPVQIEPANTEARQVQAAQQPEPTEAPFKAAPEAIPAATVEAAEKTAAEKAVENNVSEPVVTTPVELPSQAPETKEAGQTPAASVPEPVKPEGSAADKNLTTEPAEAAPVKTEPTADPPVEKPEAADKPETNDTQVQEPPPTDPIPSEPVAPPAGEKPAEPEPTSKPSTDEKPVPQPAAASPRRRASRSAALPVKTIPDTSTAELSANRPLFEPVIITVPRSAEPAATVEKADTASAGDGSSRNRLIRGTPATAAPTCRIGLSLDNMTLLTGGTMGLLVRVQGGDLGDITASSSSPKDVEAVYDPEIMVTGRRFYVVRSLGKVPGLYQINFAAPCGTKTLAVTVR